MTEEQPTWSGIASKTWGEIAGTVSGGPVPTDASAIEINVEQKLMELIAEVETLKARVGELEALNLYLPAP